MEIIAENNLDMIIKDFIFVEINHNNYEGKRKKSW